MVEQRLRLIAAEPCLERGTLGLVGARVGQGNLVGPERSLDRLAVQNRRSGPTLGCAQNKCRPSRPRRDVGRAGDASVCLDCSNASEARVEHARELLMDDHWIVARDLVDVVSMTFEQAFGAGGA